METKLLKKIALLVVFIFVANLLASKFYWYFSIWWFDMPMHFVGGVFISLAVLWLYFFKNPWPNSKIKSTLIRLRLGRCVRVRRLADSPARSSLVEINPIFLSILLVLIISVLWEIFEFSLDKFFAINLLSPIDSLSDLFFDLAGGIIGTVYFLRKVR
jgi:hypothetical protein